MVARVDDLPGRLVLLGVHTVLLGEQVSAEKGIQTTVHLRREGFLTAGMR
jgi:hypothetical protein